MRLIPTDDQGSMIPEELSKAIESDLEDNLIPFWVCIILMYNL